MSKNKKTAATTAPKTRKATAGTKAAKNEPTVPAEADILVTPTPMAAAVPPAGEEPTDAPPANETTVTAEPITPKTQSRRNATAPATDGKLSALDAAAKVLAETATPLNTQAMIDAMAARGYWSSPKGQTPAATLYAAILKEITTKGDASRFVKVARGLFGLRTQGS